MEKVRNNEMVRKQQEDRFINTLFDKSLSACVWHEDNVIREMMHGASIDVRGRDENTFDVVITVDYQKEY